MNPLVSVVIPSYNAAETLGESIESVLRQSYRPLEVIVVDDGSADDSVRIARSFGDPVVVLAKGNGGPASARNAGIAVSRGKYISFLDADDLWLPSKVERQIGVAIAAGEPVLVFAGVRRLERGSSRTANPEYKRYRGELPVCYPTLWEKNCITTSSVLAHRAVFEDALFDEDPLIQGAEDFDLWLRISDRHPIRYLDEVLTVYLVSGTGHSRSNLERTHAALNRMYRKQEAIAARHGIGGEDLKRKRFELDKAFGIRFFQCGNIPVAKQYLTGARSASWADLSLMYFSLLSYLPDSSVAVLRRIKRQLLGAVNGIRHR